MHRVVQAPFCPPTSRNALWHRTMCDMVIPCTQGLHGEEARATVGRWYSGLNFKVEVFSFFVLFNQVAGKKHSGWTFALQANSNQKKPLRSQSFAQRRIHIFWVLPRYGRICGHKPGSFFFVVLGCSREATGRYLLRSLAGLRSRSDQADHNQAQNDVQGRAVGALASPIYQRVCGGPSHMLGFMHVSLGGAIWGHRG